MNESQLRQGNNDGMDPYWEPGTQSPPINKMVNLIKDIQDHFEKIEEMLNRHKEINWETHQISFHITKYNKEKMISIIERLK